MLRHHLAKLNMELANLPFEDFAGANEVRNAIEKYESELNMVITRELHDSTLQTDELPDKKWENENSLVVALNEADNNLYAVWFKGESSVKSFELTFRAPFIPVNIRCTYLWEEDFAKKIKSTYYSELNRAHTISRAKGKSLLFLLHSISREDHLAWDFEKRVPVLICDARSYKEDLLVYNPKSDNFERKYGHCLYIPSKDFTDMTGFYIDRDSFDRRTIISDALPRPVIELPDDVIESILSLYGKDVLDVIEYALGIVNDFRLHDAADDKFPSFMMLEERVNRLIRFLTLGAPIKMLKDELELIIKSLDEIKNY